MTGRLLVLGHGYSAAVIAGALLDRGWNVTGTTRDPEKVDAIRTSGVSPILWPGEDIGPAVRAASHLLVSAAPGAGGDPFLAAARDALEDGAFDWVGYLSTTGVYGDHAGGWVDEDTAVSPSTRRGRLRVAAEAEWTDFAASKGWPLHIFRLAGIYGPGRGPFAKVRAGTARRIVKEGQVFSRIHVDDIGQVVVASIERGGPGAVWNVCDDDPAPPEAVLAYAAELLGVSVPPEEDFETAEMSEMARSFYAESKRVRNDRIKTDLGVRLKYPDFRSGLKALLEAEGAQG